MKKSTERERQWAFLKALSRLILFAEQSGWMLTGGDLKSRPGNKPKHSKNSYHYRRRAVDLNLFFKVNGKWEYQTTTEAHKELGTCWEALGGTWGGRFTNPDGNHYSWGEGKRRRLDE